MDAQEIYSEAFAKAQDEQDPLRHFRDLFVIPSIADLSRKTTGKSLEGEQASCEPSTYLCGNSLGLQPTLTRKYFNEYIATWAQKGVYGHFKEISDTHLNLIAAS